MREARYVSLIPRTTLHSDSEQKQLINLLTRARITAIQLFTDALDTVKLNFNSANIH
jgi:hypothetical protein